MAAPLANDVPTVLLACSSDPDRNILVPETYATKQKKLLTLARDRYGKEYPLEQFDLHFHHTCLNIHLNEDRCDPEIDDFLYDEGEYFVLPYVQRQKLRLFAHFVAKKRGPTQQGQEMSLPAERMNEEVPAGSDDETAITLHETSLRASRLLRPRPVLPPSFHPTRSSFTTPPNQYPFDNHHPEFPTPETVSSDGQLSRQANDVQSTSTSYPALSPEATGDRWASDLLKVENADNMSGPSE